MSCHQTQQASAHWQVLLNDLGLPPQRGAMLFELLQEQYGDDARVYHCMEHVVSVLDVIDSLAPYAADLDVVRVAAWFHDAVHDPSATDNEEQSAGCAARVLPELSLAPAQITEVERLILLTKDHRVASGDANGAVLCDADLAILGQERLVYQAYAEAIRAEYAWVPDERYRQERVRVLRNFLRREQIYHTPPMLEQREARARRNLVEEIESLTPNK